MFDTIISATMGYGNIFLIVDLLIYLLRVIANYKIFTKAGEAGYKSCIPIYNDYTSYKIAWNSSIYWVYLAATFITDNLIDVYMVGDLSGAMTAVLFICLAIACVINILYSIKLAKVFGKGTGFAIGLILLPPVFLMILGFSDAQYHKED